MSHLHASNLPTGMPRGAERTNPTSVPKFMMDFPEPAYSNNKVGNSILKLERLCTRRCQICPMLDIDSSVIISSVNNRKYPVLTNQNLS